MKKVYDIAVIGLGPAGATLCRLLDKGLSVIALDKKPENENPGGFKKPCGGLLAGDAQKALTEFDLTLPKHILVDPQIFAVKTMDLGQNLTRHYQRFYLNLDRDKFDRWLISLIPARVELRLGADFVSADLIEQKDMAGAQNAAVPPPAGPVYEVIFLQGGVKHTVFAKNIIGADGANSKIRKLFFPGYKIREYTALQQWFKSEDAQPFYSCVFDKSITDCYCWIVYKDGCFIVGGAFKKKDSARSFELLKEKLKDRGYDFVDPVKTEACIVLRPKGIFNFCTGKGGVMLAGEAAGFISPSSLEGISYALTSAQILAGVLNSKAKDPAALYHKKTFGIRFKLLLKHFKSFFMYTPWLRRIIMKSGIKSIKVAEEV